ncbi:MAG: sensor histidine kinase [Sphingomonas bacterium]|uniref:sensor histidine kinase n=1 Tax=Sphingomonas bacterium TaxID=1895847 RepID=UPI0026046F1A|nr:sensor histidine kinase [Sphingomonas bacterium]MDB5705555.1 sensor histidine kinase [Sphingomonas bacterium]
MILRSLRLRLIAYAAVAIAIALVAAWMVMGALFEHHNELRQIDMLRGEATAIAAMVSVDARGRPIASELPTDSRYRRVGSGLYWSITAPGGRLRSPSLAGATIPAAKHGATDRWEMHEAPGRFESELVIVEARVPPRGGGGPVLVQVAQDEGPLDAAADEFAEEMAVFLGALWLLLAIAAWVQVELGLRPLRRVRDDLAAMRRNAATRLGDNYPHEIEGLAAAINALAQAREEDLGRARRRAADLAHALKTPLAALAAQNRLARANGAREAADAIEQTLAAAGAVLETELARARAAASRAAGETAQTHPAKMIERLFAVLQRTEAGMMLVFDSDIPEDWRIAVDADAFAEIFGNLLDNAARFARRIVHVGAVRENGVLRFSIDDDGPGIAASERDLVLRRGARLDETGSGHGLGLAIVADLVDATGGSFILDDAPAGGLRGEIIWPDAMLTVA